MRNVKRNLRPIFILITFYVSFFALLACTAQPVSLPIVTEPAPAAPTPISLPTFTPAPSPVPGGLYVDAGQSLGQISPVFYGTNWGPWLGVPPAMLPTISSLGLKIIRFPGGHWGDQNTVSKSQIDMLMSFCKQWGAEPFFHVRLAGSSPAEAAEMVRYVNIEKGYHVRYWGIGNEANLFANDQVMNLPGYTAEQFSTDWRFFAEAMKEVDPSIKLIGPETSQFIAQPTASYGNEFDEWLITFLKKNADLVDVVAVHRYPFPASVQSGPPTKDQLRANSVEWDTIIPRLHSLVREHTGRDLPVAITELNSSWSPNTGGEATMDSHFNGIWFADVMGRMIKQDTFMLQQFAVSGKFGMMGRDQLFSQGLVYQMYNRFGTERIYAATDQQYVTIYAAKRPDGALTLMVINLNSGPKTIELKVDGFQADQAEVWLLDLEHSAEQVASVSFSAVNTLSLSPESVTLYILPAP